jgi:hypothetical protein
MSLIADRIFRRSGFGGIGDRIDPKKITRLTGQIRGLAVWASYMCGLSLIQTVVIHASLVIPSLIVTLFDH